MSSTRFRPLFEEPSEACEREDPWSGPKGFMFGGWSLPNGNNWDMAEQYYNAARLLIEGIERDRIEDYKLGIPVLYLYRLWLELAVKGICNIGREQGHDLARLSKSLSAHLEKKGIEVPTWVSDRLLEMDTVDRRSTAFRYAENEIPGEVYVSLPHLRDVMSLLNMALSSVVKTGRFPTDSLLERIEYDARGNTDTFNHDED